MMKTIALAFVAAIGLGAGPSAKADFWFDPPPGFGVPDRPEYRGGPYFVSGFGNEHANIPHRYWGGSYFVSCSGVSPPFETYRMSCRPRVVKVAIHEHRRLRARLK